MRIKGADLVLLGDRSHAGVAFYACPQPGAILKTPPVPSPAQFKVYVNALPTIHSKYIIIDGLVLIL